MIRLIIILVAIFFFISFLSGEAPSHLTEGFSMNPFSFVIAIVAIVMITGIFREAIKRRHDAAASQKDLIEIKQHIAKIEADIADIKEQIADFIIRTN